MKKSKLVSIILPIYNVSEYLEECLESILAQSYKDYEVILVDDGSTDESGKICDCYAKRDVRFKALHKVNGGVSSARNYGLDNAKGGYLCFVDPDDSVREDYISKLMSEFRDDENDISICAHEENDVFCGKMSGEEATVRILTKQLDRDVVVWGKIYRSSLFDGIRFPEGRIHEDTLTSYKIYSKAREVSYIKDVLYNYRKRSGSITKKSSALKLLKDSEDFVDEAEAYLGDSMSDAIVIARLNAWLRYIDYAAFGSIEKKYFWTYRNKVLSNRKSILKNQYLSSRLRLFVMLLLSPRGCLYSLFRKIKK